MESKKIKQVSYPEAFFAKVVINIGNILENIAESGGTYSTKTVTCVLYTPPSVTFGILFLILSNVKLVVDVFQNMTKKLMLVNCMLI